MRYLKHGHVASTLFPVLLLTLFFFLLFTPMGLPIGNDLLNDFLWVKAIQEHGHPFFPWVRIGFGEGFLATPAHTLFAMFTWILGFQYGFAVFSFVLFLIGYFGMYLFLKVLLKEEWGNVAGGLVYVFNPVIFAHMWHGGLIRVVMGYLFAPWILYFLLRFIHPRSSRSWRETLETGGALSFAAGNFLITANVTTILMLLLILIPVGLFVLVTLVRNRQFTNLGVLLSAILPILVAFYLFLAHKSPYWIHGTFRRRLATYYKYSNKNLLTATFGFNIMHGLISSHPLVRWTWVCLICFAIVTPLFLFFLRKATRIATIGCYSLLIISILLSLGPHLQVLENVLVTLYIKTSILSGLRAASRWNIISYFAYAVLTGISVSGLHSLDWPSFLSNSNDSSKIQRVATKVRKLAYSNVWSGILLLLIVLPSFFVAYTGSITFTMDETFRNTIETVDIDENVYTYVVPDDPWSISSEAGITQNLLQYAIQMNGKRGVRSRYSIYYSMLNLINKMLRGEMTNDIMKLYALLNIGYFYISRELGPRGWADKLTEALLHQHFLQSVTESDDLSIVQNTYLQGSALKYKADASILFAGSFCDYLNVLDLPIAQRIVPFFGFDLRERILEVAKKVDFIAISGGDPLDLAVPISAYALGEGEIIEPYRYSPMPEGEKASELGLWYNNWWALKSGLSIPIGTRNASRSLNVGFSTDHSGSYRILLHAYSSKYYSSDLIVTHEGESKTVETASPYSSFEGFKWFDLGEVNLEKGKQTLTLQKRADGTRKMAAVDVIGVIPNDGLNTALEKVKDMREKIISLYSTPGKFLGNVDWEFSPYRIVERGAIRLRHSLKLSNNLNVPLPTKSYLLAKEWRKNSSREIGRFTMRKGTIGSFLPHQGNITYNRKEVLSMWGPVPSSQGHTPEIFLKSFRFFPLWDQTGRYYTHSGYGSSSIPLLEYTNFSLTGIFRFTNVTSKDTKAGLMFRGSDPESVFRLALGAVGNYVEFSTKKGGEIIQRSRKNISQSIEEGKWYNLTVVGENAHFTIYVNGSKVFEVVDDTFPHGSLTGLIQWGNNAVCEYKSLSLRNATRSLYQVDFTKANLSSIANLSYLDYLLIVPPAFLKLLNGTYTESSYPVVVYNEGYNKGWTMSYDGKDYTPVPAFHMVNGFFLEEPVGTLRQMHFSQTLKKWVVTVWVCLLAPVFLIMIVKVYSLVDRKRKSRS